MEPVQESKAQGKDAAQKIAELARENAQLREQLAALTARYEKAMGGAPGKRVALVNIRTADGIIPAGKPLPDQLFEKQADGRCEASGWREGREYKVC